jgi:hypothetical protein
VVALVEREVVVEATDLRLDEGVVGGQVLAMEWVFPPPRWGRRGWKRQMCFQICYMTCSRSS